ncbi:MAG: NUDIX hydrolase [Chloroflexota bacterium]|nr:NUDIX hydrolase [Chloroflexota bacterium]
MSTDYRTPQQTWRNYRVAHGALIEDGHILLVGNAWNGTGPLIWSLPGGRAEDGEPLPATLVREFREETGLDVEIGPLLYVAEAQAPSLRQHFLTCAFAVRRTGGTLAALDAVVRDVRFVPLADLPTYLTTPSLGAPLAHWLAHPTDPARYWLFPDYLQK